MAFTHRFEPTTLREYDIRGTVGRTLFEDDAFAIGRCFGSIVARNGGRTVAVGYDGRLSSPAFEAALAKGLSASGIEAARIGRGPTPMLYYASTKLATDGAVMVTGSHNPADYNGFKMVLGRQAVLRRADPARWAGWRWPATWWTRPWRRNATSTFPPNISRACSRTGTAATGC